MLEIYIKLLLLLLLGLTFVYWCIRHIVYTYIGGFLFGYIIILAKPLTLKLSLGSIKDNLISLILISKYIYLFIYFLIMLLGLFMITIYNFLY